MFEAARRDGRWMVSDGAVVFGPYETQARAQEAAASLNRQRAWSLLSPDQLVDRHPV